MRRNTPRMQRPRSVDDTRVQAQRQPRRVHSTDRVHVGNYDWIRPRQPDGRFGRGWCQDKPVFVVAGGPSLIGFEFERIRPYTTITINRSHRYCRSDVICFVDAETGHDIKRIDGTLDLGPRIVASNYAGLTPGGKITTLRIGRNLNITDPSLPVYGPASSTLVAISIALIGGASHVFLLGVDCRFVRGQDHFHPHPVPQCKTDETKYQRMAKAFDVFAPARDRIYNLSSVSTVRTFPRITIEHALRIADEDEHTRYHQPMPTVPRRP